GRPPPPPHRGPARRRAGGAGGAPPPHPTDDFFSLGGDSIVAVELAVRLEDALGIEVDADLLVQLPDFAALADALAPALAARAGAAPVPSTPER
ncbi:acyl carrier protein, partial [Kitasatospora sp. NPDC059571]|uniref:acyl carrier protein n=1 Tax=Kitasatospora sp. NPDC059571 TaxID=3346871 RepID=UPI0036B3CE31